MANVTLRAAGEHLFKGKTHSCPQDGSALQGKLQNVGPEPSLMSPTLEQWGRWLDVRGRSPPGLWPSCHHGEAVQKHWPLVPSFNSETPWHFLLDNAVIWGDVSSVLHLFNMPLVEDSIRRNVSSWPVWVRLHLPQSFCWHRHPHFIQVKSVERGIQSEILSFSLAALCMLK